MRYSTISGLLITFLEMVYFSVFFVIQDVFCVHNIKNPPHLDLQERRNFIYYILQWLIETLPLNAGRANTERWHRTMILFQF